MIDLKELMESRSATPPPTAGLRYAQVQRRIVRRNRRRVTVVGAAVAVALALIGGYAAIPKTRTAPQPAVTPTPTPSTVGGFPTYQRGARLLNFASAPAAAGTVSMTWTPSTVDFVWAYECTGLPERVRLDVSLTVNDKSLSGSTCGGGSGHTDDTAASAVYFGMRVGVPSTITLKVNKAQDENLMATSMPTGGTIAVAIYERVAFEDYPVPSRPTLKPLASWRNCQPEQTVRGEAGDPPISLTTIWRDHLMFTAQAQTPGKLHIAINGIRISTQEWWDFDARQIGDNWDTKPSARWAKFAGWKQPKDGQKVTITLTPEHLTGAWQFGVTHTDIWIWHSCDD